WVRRLLERGLARDPDQRWPSMDALLAALDRRRSRRRWQRVTAVLSGVLVIGTVVNVARGLDRRHRTRACTEAATTIETLWPAHEAEVLAVLRASSLGYVRRLESTLVPQINAWAEQWATIRTEACEAATVHGTIDEIQRVRVEMCLHAQRVGVATLIELVAKGDPMALRRAPQMLANLPPIQTCGDPEQVEALPLPRVDDMGTLRGLVGRWLRAMALQDAGRYDEALAEAEPLLEHARDRGWAPMGVEVGLLVGALHADQGHYLEAVDVLRGVYFEAGSAGLESAAATAAARLIEVEGVSLARPDAGLVWSRHARMMMSRMDEGMVRSQGPLILEGLAHIHRLQGDHGRALELLQRTLDMRRRTLGSDHPEVARTLRELAAVHVDRGAFADAESLDRRALAMLERSLGDDHPEIAKALCDLASVVARTDAKQARALYARALSTLEQGLGPTHPDLAVPLHAVAALDERQGDYARAFALHERGLTVRLEALPADHPDLADSFEALARVHQATGDFEGAVELYEHAVAISRSALGSMHPRVAKRIARLTAAREVLEGLAGGEQDTTAE
ncbi:MAG: tetratricopeptide repeat protein, partial [Myxococcales bacterium]|nr:tetratricopeptide repeat protein [Myxococcales bacterium]